MSKLYNPSPDFLDSQCAMYSYGEKILLIVKNYDFYMTLKEQREILKVVNISNMLKENPALFTEFTYEGIYTVRDVIDKKAKTDFPTTL